MATLEERIQNLTQEVNPSSGAISDMEMKMMASRDSLGSTISNKDREISNIGMNEQEKKITKRGRDKEGNERK